MDTAANNSISHSRHQFTMSAEPSAAGPSRNPRTYGSNARSASLPYPHPSQSTPRNPLPAQQAIADTPSIDIPHRPARERTGRPMMSLPADEQGEAADTREERESSEEVVCTGHLFEGKNRLGKINPSRAAKAKAAQQPKTWIPSRQRSIPAVKLEPGVDGKEGDSYVYNKAHAVKKAHLPPGTLFEGARVMDDEEIARMVDVLRKGP